MKQNNTPTLTTERLILRQFTENDRDALFRIYSDKKVNTYLPWFPLQSLEETKIFFDIKYKRIYQQPQGYHYAICFKEDNIPMGYVHVSMDASHDFGYALCKEYWHQGIVSEASEAVIKQLKKDGIPFITATHDVKNKRSGLVMKKLHMKYQYSYEEQWMPKDILVTFRMYQLNLDGDLNRVYSHYWDQSLIHFVEENI